MRACEPWLSAELALLDPEVVVLLGATAGKALLGPSFRVTKSRGVLLPRETGVARGAGPGDDGGDEQASLFGGDPAGDAPPRRGQSFWLPTVHPSAVLRADDSDAALAGLVADLRVAAEVLAA